MAKRETKETYGDIRNDKTSAQGIYNDVSSGAAQNYQNVAPFVASGRENLSNYYGGMAGAPGIGSAPISTTPMSNVYNQFGEIAASGGYSPETRGSILQNVGGLKEIGRTGGYNSENIARARGMGGFEQLLNEGGLSPEQQFRMRGAGGYDEFAATGGYSEGDKSNIRARAISPIASMASGTSDELARRRSVQNSYAPGFDAANRALQRDTSRSIGDISLNADIELQDRVNQGRMAGISGVAGTEANLQGLRTGNIARGASGVSGAELSMVANRTGNQLRGLESASQIESDLSARIAQYRLQGMSGQQASAMAMADIENMNVGNSRADRMAGISGMEGMYQTDIGLMQAERDRQLQLINAGQNTNLGYINPQTQLAMQPGMGSNIMKGIGTAAGIAGMAYTGGASSLINRGGGGSNVTQAQGMGGGVDPRYRYYGY